MDKFKTRKMKKGEAFPKKCSCNIYMPEEYSICDYCLLRKFADHSMLPEAVGCCSCQEAGYTEKQVMILLRRAIGETVVEF